MRSNHWLLIVAAGFGAAAVVLWPAASVDAVVDSPSCPLPVTDEAVAVGAPRPPAVPVRHAPPAGSHGRVVDPCGRPVPGVLVAGAGSSQPVRSGPEGEFALGDADFDRCRVLPSAGQLALRSPLLDLCLPRAAAATLVVAPAGPLSGLVLGPDGTRIAGARVTVDLQVALPGLAPVRGPRIAGDWDTASDADGQFFFAQVPLGSGARLCVAHPEFVSFAQELAESTRSVTARLDKAEAQPPVRVRVLGQSDQPVVGAEALLGALRAGSDAQGLLVQEPMTPGPLTVTAPGYAPLRCSVPPVVAGERALVTARLLPLVTLVGRLVETEGQPCAGWWVVPVASQPGLYGRFAALPVACGPDGRFAFAGIPQGTYQLEAWQPLNARVFRSHAVPAPANGLELRVPPPAALPARLRGRVLTLDGQPLARVCVGLGRPTGWGVPGPAGIHAGAACETDAEGGFELATAGLAALELRVEGEDLVPSRVAIELGSEASIEVRVARRRKLRFATVPLELGGARLAAVAADGSALPVWTSPVLPPHPRQPLCAGTSYGLDNATRELLVVRGDQELGRITLETPP